MRLGRQQAWRQRLRDGLFDALMVLVVALMLSACGGGSTQKTPQAVAGSGATVTAGTSVVLDGSASSNPTASALSYTWRVASAPTGSAATLDNPSAVKPTFTPDLAGSYTLSLVVSNDQATSSPSTLTIVSTGTSLPAIELGTGEPLSGSVPLSLSGTVSGAVTWYLDLQLLGTGSGNNGSYSWNTLSVANTSHQLLARIQTGTNTFQEVRRTVQVGNSPITLSASSSVASGTLTVSIRASSTNGMTSVSAQLDGGTSNSLNAPNACSRYCSSNDLWTFSFSGVNSGSHSVLVTALDGAGQTKTQTLTVQVSNAPSLSLSSPGDGQLVFGTLSFSGAASTDKTGGVTVTAKLGDLTVPVSQSGATFSGSYDITGATARAYALTVTATDVDQTVSTVTRTVYVTSSQALAYTPVMTLPTGGSVVAVEGDLVLYRNSASVYILRNLNTSNEVALQDAGDVQYANDWQISNGQTFAYGKGSDCVLYCVYQWDASGTRSNLTRPNPYSPTSNVGGGWAYDLHPVAKDGYVLWINDKASAQGWFTLYKVSTREYTKIPAPSGVNYLGNWNYDLAVVGGTPEVYFWGQTGGTGTTSAFDVYRLASGTSTKLTGDSARNIYVQTDGERAAWQSSPAGGNADGSFALQATPVGSNSVSNASTIATSFILKGGVLAWVEQTSTSRAIKAITSSGLLQTLSTQSNAALMAVGGGRVAFSQGGKLYSWDATTNSSTLRLDSAPGSVWVTGGRLLMVVGESVYGVGL
jgi:PKD domain